MHKRRKHYSKLTAIYTGKLIINSSSWHKLPNHSGNQANILKQKPSIRLNLFWTMLPPTYKHTAEQFASKFEVQSVEPPTTGIIPIEKVQHQ